jgi:hypothetical protein
MQTLGREELHSPHFSRNPTVNFVECGQKVGKRKKGPTALHDKVLVRPAFFGVVTGRDFDAAS